MNNHSSTAVSAIWGALKIAGLYVLIGGLWILFSDKAAAMLVHDPDTLTQISLVKGWVYVFVTGVLLYWLIQRQTTNILKSEKLYRLLAENTADVIWILDIQTMRFAYVSPSVEKMRGYSAEEVMEQGLSAALTPESTRYLEQVLPERLEEFHQGITKSYTDQIDQPRKDGTTVYTETTTRFFANPQNGALEVYGVSRDINERKQVEEKLRESEERLRLSLFAAKQGLYDLNVQTGEAVVNRQYAQMLGYDPETFHETNSAWLGRLHPDDKERTAKTYTDYVNGQISEYRVEFRQRTADGDWKWILSLGKIVEYDLHGQPLRMVGTHTDITDLKHAQEALRESEERFRTAFDNMLEGVQILNTDWRYLYLNEVAEKHNRRPNQELLGRRYMDMWPGIEDTNVFALIRHCMDDRIAHKMENEFIFPDGAQGWFELSLLPIPEGILILSVDITERKRTEAALLQSEQKYALLFNQAAIPAALTKLPENIFVEINTAFEKIFGYSEQEVIGKTSLQLGMVRPEERERTVAEIQQYGTVRDNEKHLFTKAGEMRIASVNVNVVEINGHRYAITTLLDITERKQAENELRQSQDNFARAFSSNPAALAVTRLTDGTFVSLNETYTKILGYEPAEILGRTVADLNIYVNPDERNQLLQQLREQGRVRNYELLVHIKSGEIRSLVVSMEPILYDNEECILSTFLDVTERKQMEDELRRSNAELEQFAYVASHDLQEPLRAVAGMVQLLGRRYKGQLDERADEYIGHAVEASGRMQKLINDLLDYSRVDRRSRPFEQTNLEGSLHSALTNLQISIEDSQAQITHDPLPTVMGDPGQLIQLLQNLIGNAIKFRDERPLHIHVGAEKVENCWRISVRDNGIGIDPQFYDRIFLVFQRLHTRREYPGTGIGLALCKKIVERHGGEIWVDSQPEQGATFYFTIPEIQHEHQTV